MAVYLIRAGVTGPVKLGHASSCEDALRRLAALQVAHWETLHLLRMWEGDERAEGQLHARFADLRIRGEWFGFSRLMLADVGLPVIDIPQRDADAPLSALDVMRRLGGQGDTARLCGPNRGAVSVGCLRTKFHETAGRF